MHVEKMAVHHAVSYNPENLEFVKFLVGKEKVKLFSSENQRRHSKWETAKGFEIS